MDGDKTFLCGSGIGSYGMVLRHFLSWLQSPWHWPAFRLRVVSPAAAAILAWKDILSAGKGVIQHMASHGSDSCGPASPGLLTESSPLFQACEDGIFEKSSLLLNFTSELLTKSLFRPSVEIQLKVMICSGHWSTCVQDWSSLLILVKGNLKGIKAELC